MTNGWKACRNDLSTNEEKILNNDFISFLSGHPSIQYRLHTHSRTCIDHVLYTVYSVQYRLTENSVLYVYSEVGKYCTVRTVYSMYSTAQSNLVLHTLRLDLTPSHCTVLYTMWQDLNNLHNHLQTFMPWLYNPSPIFIGWLVV